MSKSLKNENEQEKAISLFIRFMRDLTNKTEMEDGCVEPVQWFINNLSPQEKE